MTQEYRFARLHSVFAALATSGFVAHLVANLFVEQMYWLPEYTWGGSLAFAVLAIHAGCPLILADSPHRRGFALASTIIGTAVLLGLMYSGITWLFVPADTGGVAM